MGKLGRTIIIMTVITGIVIGGVAFLWLSYSMPAPTIPAPPKQTQVLRTQVSLPPQWTPTPSATPTLTPTVWSTIAAGLAERETELGDLLNQIGTLYGPRINLNSTTSVTIAWETEHGSTGEIVYGTTDSYRWSVSDAKSTTKHHVTLTDLEPYTQYHYRLISQDLPLTDDLIFQTAAGQGQKTFSFVVYGDTQHNPAIHRSILDHALSLNPDFGLHVGDLVNNGLDESAWNNFFSIEQDFLARVPLYPTLGNHEQLSEHYFDRFYLPHNERWYDFEHGHARFICLEMDGYADIDELSEQYHWLKRRLAENTQPWTFVFFHKSPYTSEYEGPTEQYIRSQLSPLFEQYGVQLVFSGHNHNYQRSLVKNIFYIVTGGGGGELSSSIEPDEYLQIYKVTHHFVSISIDGDQLVGRAITLDGEVFDSFDLTLP